MKSSNGRYRPALRAGLAALALCGLSTAWAYSGQELAKSAKLSVKQARAIALKAYPGQVKDVELEKESGGSGLRYSFDIAQGAQLHEVGVDAATGEVLENSVESASAD